MKKIVIALCLLLACAGVRAQSFKLVFAQDIPADAAEMLQQRFTQMLSGGGLSVSDEGTPMEVSANIVNQEQTDGSLGQCALEIELQAAVGDISGTFPLKGVGDTLEDAFLRAAKQFLPRSKTTQEFVGKFKELNFRPL